MPQSIAIDDACHAAAELISQADGLVITAGAGMGIDSGLPDFRGDTGFWNAYPALGKLGMRFFEVANPVAFASKPEIAWGFYGHRLKMYRETVPHVGFAKLLELSRRIPKGAFVFTSNVDGHFQKAGFSPDHVAECHGSIHYLQCLDQCGEVMWGAESFVPEVDVVNCKLLSKVPTCPACGGMARPNILMFGDWHWDEMRWAIQHARLGTWLARVKWPVILELGAGTGIPTVRRLGEKLDCPLIRINPTEAKVGLRRDIAISLGALEGIVRITDKLNLMPE